MLCLVFNVNYLNIIYIYKVIQLHLQNNKQVKRLDK